MTLGEDEVGELFSALARGEDDALEQIIPHIYDDLRRVARQQLRRWRPGETLQTTALVHESFLRLNRLNANRPVDRSHFLAVAARSMRHIIVDYARERSATKRGSGITPISLDDVQVADDQHIETVLAINEALERLAQIDIRLMHVVECRFFTGLTAAETAEALDVSRRTIDRDWLRARAWLESELA